VTTAKACYVLVQQLRQLGDIGGDAAGFVHCHEIGGGAPSGIVLVSCTELWFTARCHGRDLCPPLGVLTPATGVQGPNTDARRAQSFEPSSKCPTRSTVAPRGWSSRVSPFAPSTIRCLYSSAEAAPSQHVAMSNNTFPTRQVFGIGSPIHALARRHSPISLIGPKAGGSGGSNRIRRLKRRGSAEDGKWQLCRYFEEDL
jgi:hypothetical protein